MALNELNLTPAQRSRNFDRKAAVACLAILAIAILAGFGPTYYFKLASALGEYRLSTHLHGLVMTAWVLVFAAQIYFVRSKKILLHMRLGLAAIGLAVAVVVVGFIVAIQAARLGSPSSPADIPPLSFLIVPLGDILIFALLFAAAIYYRKVPANHKRLMLLTAINFMPAAVARIPIPELQALGPLWFYGFPDLVFLVLIAIDTWWNRKLNWAFAIGGLLLIASHPIRLMLSGTEAWLSIARWLTG